MCLAKMKHFSMFVSFLLLCGCASGPDTWEEAFAQYDQSGCQPSFFSRTQFEYCVSYLAAEECDQKYGLQKSWRDMSSRSEDWVECAQSSFERMANEIAAQRSAAGKTLTKTGTALLNDSPASNSSATSVGRPSPNLNGYLIREEEKGGNKICYYNVIGTTYAKNVGIADLCPITATF